MPVKRPQRYVWQAICKYIYNMHKFIALPLIFLTLTGLYSTSAFSQNKDVTVPKASYPGMMPELAGKNEFISVYVKNQQVHVAYKKIYTLLDSVNTFREFYCRMIQLADSTDEGFSLSNSYISLYIDTSVSYSFVDNVLEALKQAEVDNVLLKTRNKKVMNVGFYVPLVPMPEKRMSYVSNVYGMQMTVKFDRYACLYANKPVIITDDNDMPPPPPPTPPPSHPPYLNDDIVKKYKQSLTTGIDSTYFLVNWKNNQVFLNNTGYSVAEITKLIERNPKSFFLIEMSDKQSYTSFIKLLDNLWAGYYMVLDNYCQKKFKKSARDVSTYALREIEKVIPLKYYILSRAELMYINDVNE
jgi:biopolymer transport protein ExbD